MADIFNMADTWNNAGTTFTAIKMDVTNTNSAAASMLLDLLVGGTSKFKVRKDSSILLNNTASFDYGQKQAGFFTFSVNDGGFNFAIGGNGPNSLNYLFASYAGGTADVGLTRTSAGLIQVFDGVTPGAFRDLHLRNLRLNPVAVSALVSASTAGQGSLAWVTDATATTPRSTVAGGGSNKVLVASDGTNWIIIA